jgi:hexosaminidase
MKIFSRILVPFFLSVLLLSCQSPAKMGDFKVLPQPQQIEIVGNSSLEYDDIQHYHSIDGSELPWFGALLQHIEPVEKPGKAEIIFRIDVELDLPAEGYTLDISKKQVSITGKDKAGLLYAFMTLNQLLEDAREQDVSLPVCSIKDYPLLSYRAIHLDMKHHLEKTEYYFQMLDKLASYKMNAIIVELEDKIAYERRAGIGSEDALSIDEWKELSEYAMERNIEISPLVQGLGHASFILKHDQYKGLRDDPKSDWAFNPLDPGTYELQFDLYLDAMEATPYGRYLHVGGDEVHTTGRGSGKTELELQLTWLNKVCDFAAEHGRTPIFWDDMPIKYAGVYRTMFNPDISKEEVNEAWDKNEGKLLGFLDQFPKNCIYMRWNYFYPQAEGNLKAMDWFLEHGMQVMGATAGQTRWVLMPQLESNMDNIRSFALTSIDKGLDRILLTLWDDDSPHFELYWRGILFFSEYTWTGEKRSREELKSAYRHREFTYAVTDPAYAFIDDLEQPVIFWKNGLLNGNLRNYLARSEDPVNESVIDFPNLNNKGEWSMKHSDRLEKAEALMEDYESIAARINKMKSLASRNMYTLEVYEQVNELAVFAPKALLSLKALDASQNEQEEIEALEKLNNLVGEFSALRNKFEQVYGETRILTKPANYILDQDHHVHLGNQSISFDWQFYAEILFLEKVRQSYP